MKSYMRVSCWTEDERRREVPKVDSTTPELHFCDDVCRKNVLTRSSGTERCVGVNKTILLAKSLNGRQPSQEPTSLNQQNQLEMVSTRGHPESFDRSMARSPTKRNTAVSRARKSPKWTHSPSNLTLIWLAISLPLVIWDTGYVMLRPYSMPGGSLHWPVWLPYELYGKVDYIYGWKAFNERNGFTAAQGTLNIVETAMYLFYLYVFYTHGKQSVAEGRGAPTPAKAGFLGEQRFVEGKMGALAALVAFAASVMTTSKTVLYWLNESYSGFENIGHNRAIDLLFLWIIPNGAWIALPSYMIYVTGSEILQGLTAAASGDEKNE